VLKSVGLYASLGDQRSFIGLEYLERYNGLLGQLVEGQRSVLSDITDIQDVEKLVRKGLLFKVSEGSYAFVSPLHMQYYMVQVRLYARHLVGENPCHPLYLSSV
jgi:hypothetical protein